jgi:hypothetical protein
VVKLGIILPTYYMKISNKVKVTAIVGTYLGIAKLLSMKNIKEILPFKYLEMHQHPK